MESEIAPMDLDLVPMDPNLEAVVSLLTQGELALATIQREAFSLAMCSALSLELTVTLEVILAAISPVVSSRVILLA